MPFSNPIIGGGGDLVRKSIKSPNYVPGVSGWAINQDGSAEFQNVIIPGGGSVSISALTSGSLSADADLAGGSVRSAAAGTRIVLDAAGLRLYSGGSNTVNLDASSGDAFFSGSVSGSSITGSSISGASITGTTITGGTYRTDSSGARVELSNSFSGQIALYDLNGNVAYIYKSDSPNEVRSSIGFRAA